MRKDMNCPYHEELYCKPFDLSQNDQEAMCTRKHCYFFKEGMMQNCGYGGACDGVCFWENKCPKELPTTHETVEQWEKRMGMTLPDTSPVWVLVEWPYKEGQWKLKDNKTYKEIFTRNFHNNCEVFGVVAEPYLFRPHYNWRPTV